MKDTIELYKEFRKYLNREDYIRASKIITGCERLVDLGKISLSEILQVNIGLQKSIINKLEDRAVCNY